MCPYTYKYGIHLMTPFRRCLLLWQGNVWRLKNAKDMVSAAVQHYQTTVLHKVDN